MTANSVSIMLVQIFLIPNTTSATTFKLQWLSEAGGATCYLNRGGIKFNVFTTKKTAMEKKHDYQSNTKLIQMQKYL
ncbi:MAG: hypothetical protein CM15mV87_310 [Caudoviricetes sp.]|nr:MAG: hypothetical protein CM15mV87_310 [Caudoviricetes sp.]